MRTYQNPFRVRAVEQERDPLAFLRNFGVGVLELLPDTVWDRLLVMRSAPGGGKTSLMRLFTAESLSLVSARRADLKELAEFLETMGAIAGGELPHHGVLVSLDRDYRALADIGSPTETSVRLFFHLLDARIVTAFIRSVVARHGGVFPRDCDRVRFRLRHELHGSEEAASRLGGTEGSDLLQSAREIEKQILDSLDALHPSQELLNGVGHTDLYALRFLSDTDTFWDNKRVGSEPLLMFDDGHELTVDQRAELWRRLRSRDLSLARWYSERFQALTPQETLSTGDIAGRDFELLELESRARQGEGTRFDRLLVDVADRRAARPLQQYAGGASSFSELCRVDDLELLGEHPETVVTSLETRTRGIVEEHSRYEPLLDRLVSDHERSGYSYACALRELEIQIARDLQRTPDLFPDLPLSTAEASRLRAPNLGRPARLFLAAEYKLPYYAGPGVVARLASHNMEQLLSVCGEIFEEMLASITLGRRPEVSALRQDATVRRLSEAAWRSLPRRVPFGQDVQRLISAIGTMANKETYRPTAPYSPGVTGTAILMSDRDRLVRRDTTQTEESTERLVNSLGSAIAFNVLSAEPDRSVKGSEYMVLYLNRILCPRFGLPLGRGGFRERRLSELTTWIEDAPVSESPIPNTLPL